MPIPGTGGMRFGDLYVKVRATQGAAALPCHRGLLLWEERSQAACNNWHSRAADAARFYCHSPHPGSSPRPQFNVVLPTPEALDGRTLAALRAALPRTMDRRFLAAAKKKEEEGGAGAGDDGRAASPPQPDGGDVDMAGSPAGSSPNVGDGHAGGAADVEEVTLSDVSVDVRRARVQAQAEAARHAGGSEAYDSDDEDGSGGQRVQCAQQ
jgi:hypothetical protein